MNREECLQCGTRIVGNDCATCDRAGRTEALAMAGILALIALSLGLYVWLQLM
jgi:hypothetical protein